MRNFIVFIAAVAVVSTCFGQYRTPEIHQASVSLEREIAHPVVAEVSYSFVHGQNLIRARDVNLPRPSNVQYPIFDSSGLNLLGYGSVESFATWQFTSSQTCPFTPCVNPLARPLPQLGSIDVFESEASSVYHGSTISVRRQMTHGLYFRLGYTYAMPFSNIPMRTPLMTGRIPWSPGRASTVQNSYSPSSERGNGVTDQRSRFVVSWTPA
jgi:hypothetical protein